MFIYVVCVCMCVITTYWPMLWTPNSFIWTPHTFTTTILLTKCRTDLCLSEKHFNVEELAEISSIHEWRRNTEGNRNYFLVLKLNTVLVRAFARVICSRLRFQYNCLMLRIVLHCCVFSFFPQCTVGEIQGNRFTVNFSEAGKVTNDFLRCNTERD